MKFALEEVQRHESAKWEEAPRNSSKYVKQGVLP